MLIKKLLLDNSSESHYCAIKGHPLEAIAQMMPLGKGCIPAIWEQ